MTPAYVYAATRTPFGRFNGALSGMLGTVPRLDAAEVDDVVWGNANGSGEENRNVVRMAVLLARLPVSVPATTVNRLCRSSLDAAMIAHARSSPATPTRSWPAGWSR